MDPHDPGIQTRENLDHARNSWRLACNRVHSAMQEPPKTSSGQKKHPDQKSLHLNISSILNEHIHLFI